MTQEEINELISSIKEENRNLEKELDNIELANPNIREYYQYIKSIELLAFPNQMVEKMVLKQVKRLIKKEKGLKKYCDINNSIEKNNTALNFLCYMTFKKVL